MPQLEILYSRLPDGCELTVGELRDMASRQQQQIETQQQLLVAREQRLKYLKQQESRAAAVAAEAERLRRLKERVELQEAKLRRLRALRGQVEATRLNTASLTTDLDAMRQLFSEKEKELVVAVTKVEELTRQLEELRQGRSPLNPGDHHHNELDKLRRELLYRNSVNREASARVAAQRETLAARREEISRIDKRVSELQQRLHRKRLLNQQLASQITAATQAKQAQLKAVQQKALREGIHSSSSVDDAQTPAHLKIPRGEDLAEFSPNKSDPKYQTLPYNTKFSVTQKNRDSDSCPPTPTTPTPTHPDPPLAPSTTPAAPTTTTTTPGGGGGGVLMTTVHSIPTHPPPRSLAHALPSQVLPPPYCDSRPPKPPPNPAMTPRVFGPGTQHFTQRTQPLGGAALTQTQKLSPGVTSQSRALLISSQDTERGGEGGEEGVRGVREGAQQALPPPKPPVPSKPLPPPRQKGDQLGGSTDPLTTPGPPPSRPSSLQTRPPHAYRYASQNVIMSTYTQAGGGGSGGGGDTPGTPEDDSTTTTSNKPKSTTTNNNNVDGSEKIHVSINRRIEMPPDFMFPEDETPPSDLLGRRVEEMEADGGERVVDSVDNAAPLISLSELRIEGSKDEGEAEQGVEEREDATGLLREENRQPDGADTSTLLASEELHPDNEDSNSKNKNARQSTSTSSTTTTTTSTTTLSNINNLNNNTTNNNTANNNTSGGGVVMRRLKKGNLKTKNSSKVPRRVSFDPLALLLDASLEGELELVKRTAMEVSNPSAANDEGITALHNAICAGHLEIVTFLVTFGCDVNAQDSDGWTPLHCAASCNNVAMVRFLVEHGACILATTLSDHETPAEKCEQDEEGYDGCSQYLYSVQEKLGIMNGGVVYAVYDYEGQATDELTFDCSDALTVLRRGDEYEREWWWAQHGNLQGYVPRNLLGLYPRVKNPLKDS
ncbi:apoptosis-stimulating of p53 protein 2-like isoform X3 [Scylla paramamosain]|uniref:apoptosis-stimulating of p53 protein 2-like isoform X3 n=1 Tax=Scylla paramamosain TaxID=85552 RepID=UPI00308371D1